MGMLEALEPLRDLADQETAKRLDEGKESAVKEEDKWKGGQQTERYLKRYIEIFREQSFAIISMYKSIFPSALPVPETTPTPHSKNVGSAEKDGLNLLTPLPSPLSTFPAHLTSLLLETLRMYLPNVAERSARDSLLTQVLYCAGSLGRLGADFSLLIAGLGVREQEEEEEEEEGDFLDEEGWEWVEVMKKHRVQASRLELLASGVGTGGGRGERVGSVTG